MSEPTPLLMRRVEADGEVVGWFAQWSTEDSTHSAFGFTRREALANLDERLREEGVEERLPDGHEIAAWFEGKINEEPFRQAEDGTIWVSTKERAS